MSYEGTYVDMLDALIAECRDGSVRSSLIRHLAEQERRVALESEELRAIRVAGAEAMQVAFLLHDSGEVVHVDNYGLSREGLCERAGRALLLAARRTT